MSCHMERRSPTVLPAIRIPIRPKRSPRPPNSQMPASTAMHRLVISSSISRVNIPKWPARPVIPLTDTSHHALTAINRTPLGKHWLPAPRAIRCTVPLRSLTAKTCRHKPAVVVMPRYSTSGARAPANTSQLPVLPATRTSTALFPNAPTAMVSHIKSQSTINSRFASPVTSTHTTCTLCILSRNRKSHWNIARYHFSIKAPGNSPGAFLVSEHHVLIL